MAARLTGLVNNAAGNFISPTEALSPRGFDAIANIVFHGSFYVTQAVGKRWVERGQGAGGWKPGQPMTSRDARSSPPGSTTAGPTSCPRR